MDSKGFPTLRSRESAFVDKTCAIAELLSSMHNRSCVFFARNVRHRDIKINSACAHYMSWGRGLVRQGAAVLLFSLLSPTLQSSVSSRGGTIHGGW